MNALLGLNFMLEDKNKQEQEVDELPENLDELFNDIVEENFEKFIRNHERLGIKLKLTDEIKKYFRCKECESGFYFTFDDSSVYLSRKRKTHLAWRDFIKNHWYNDKSSDFRIRVYLEIYRLLESEENDMDITEQENRTSCED